MRLITLFFIVLAFTGCSESEIPYVFSHDNVESKTFTYRSNSITFVSEDSLNWKISSYRDEPIVYKLQFETIGNDISFEVRDTVRVDYTDPFGNNSFVKTIYYDSFEGTFLDENAIDAPTVNHYYETWVEDLYRSEMGGATLNIEYTR